MAAHLLPRFRARALEAERQAKIARILLDSQPVRVTAKATAAGDSRQLRGIPAVAPGVSGAQPGTQPERELLRREAERER